MFISKKIAIIIFFVFPCIFLYSDEFLYLLDPCDFESFHYPSHSMESSNYIRSSVYFFKWNNYEENLFLDVQYKSISLSFFSHQIEAPYINEKGDSIGDYTIGQYLISSGIKQNSKDGIYGINFKVAYEKIDTFERFLPLTEIYFNVDINDFIIGMNVNNISVTHNGYPPVQASFYVIRKIKYLYIVGDLSYSYYRHLSFQSSLIFKPYKFIYTGVGGYLNGIINRFDIFIEFNFLNTNAMVGYVIEYGEGSYRRDITGLSIKYNLK